MGIGDNLFSIQRTLKAQRHFVQSLSSREWFCEQRQGAIQRNPEQEIALWPEAKFLKDMIMDVAKGLGDIKAELRYAKREAGWDYLGPKELVELTRLLNGILTSMLWMGSLVEMATRIERRGFNYFRGSGISHLAAEFEREAGQVEKQQWHWIIEQTCGPTERLSQAMEEGIEHVMYSLRLRKPPVTSRLDQEANRNVAAKHLEQMIGDYLQQQQGPLKTWLIWNDMDHPSQVEALKSGQKPADSQIRERHQFQLYFLLDVSALTPEIQFTNLLRVELFVR